MAKELGDLIVRLSLDSTKFDNALKRFESQMTAVQKQFKSSATGLTDFDKVTGKLKSSAETLTERLASQKEKVAQLERAYERSKQVKGEDAEETQKLAAKLEAAKAKVSQTEQALKLVNEQIKLNSNGWYQLGVNLEGVGSKLQSVGQSITSVGTKLSIGVTAPIVALGTQAIKSGIAFESAFAGVRKTVDASEAEFTDLSDSIKKMSERIPATTTELAGVMEMAGQLGVRGSDNLKKFTEVITALGVSTNLTREDAASMLAQFANITGMDLSNIDKLGSTIVALGNNFATTESDIVSMAHRLAGAGSQLGMSEAQIMGFSAALSSVGIEAEAGGSAFSKLMISMKVAAETGMKGKEVISQTGMSLRELQLLADQDSKSFKALAAKLGLTTEELKGFMGSASDLDSFAQVTGMTAQQFAKAYGEDAAGAMMTFLQGLNKIEAEGGSAIVTLDEMGITEVRLRDAILRASGATDLFAEAQTLANGAWEDNIALQNEANQRYATTESQLAMLKNAANNLAIQFADIMMPTLLKLVEKLKGVVAWLQGLSEEQKRLIATIAAVAAAVGPVLVIVGKITSGVGSFLKILAPLAKALGGAKMATGGLGTALSALTSPVVLVIAAIAALVAIFINLYNTNEEFRAKVQAVWSQICSAFENAKAVFSDTWQSFISQLEPVKEAFGKLWETANAVFLQLWNLLEPIILALGVLLGGLVAVCLGVANGILNAIAPAFEAIVNGIDFVMNIIGAVVALLQGDFSGAWEFAKSALSAFGSFCSNIFTAIANFFSGFWELICSIALSFGLDLQSIVSGAWSSIQEGISVAWSAITEWLSSAWSNIQSIASSAWTSICDAALAATNTGKEWLSTAWENTKSTVTEKWDALKTGASTAWQNICLNAKNAVVAAQSGIQSAWTTISTGISTGWTLFKNTASSAWTNITSGVNLAISGAQSGIVTAWENIKSGVKSTWDGLTEIFKNPIESVTTWLSEKVEWFKGLFNFQWKLPEFKLPKINVTWKDIGWGISLPTLSVSWNALGGIFNRPTIFATANGLQGVGEAGPEAILPLNTLWEELSARTKDAMREILMEAHHAQAAREDALLSTLIGILKSQPPEKRSPPHVQVTQNIYAQETSYAGQQREAARNFRQIARTMV